MGDEDLGALLAAATRRVIDAEKPLLEAHGIAMWGYVALTVLAREPAPTQVALAQAMRYDKTRLIGVLDRLEADGLITRRPDPSDRRATVVGLTDAGERRRAALQRDIRAMEDRLLAGVEPAQRRLVRDLLARVAATAASLDGFIAGRGGDMSWLSEHKGGSGTDAEDLMASTGALLIGRRTFDGDDPNRGTDSEGAFGGAWRGPSVVLTHRPPPGPPVPDVTFATDLTTAVRAARDAAGGRWVNVLGADVARQCLDAGVLDEIVVFVVPVLLGDGVRLFDRPGGPRVRLEPVEPRPTDGHRFRVVR